MVLIDALLEFLQVLLQQYAMRFSQCNKEKPYKNKLQKYLATLTYCNHQIWIFGAFKEREFQGLKLSQINSFA